MIVLAETTLQTMRQSLSENMGDFESFATTADGSAAFKSVISTALLDLLGGGDEDAFENFYLLVADSSSSADGESRRVANYVPDLDNPTLLFDRPFSVQIESGVTVELHRFDPTDKGNAIRQAIRELQGDLYLNIRDESLIVDNLLSNSGFETFSSGFTGWTEVGSPTVTQETTIIRHGSGSAKVVAAAGAAGQLTQAPTINIDELTNETARTKRWVYATAANTARLRLDWDGSNFANSSYHSGRDQWELLEIEAAVPSTATQVKAICEVVANGTGYFDLGWLKVLPVYQYTIPTALLQGPRHVHQQANEDHTEGPYYPIPDDGIPTEGRILRLRGKGILSQPTTDSGTTEVGEPQTQLIVAYAKMLMYRLMASPARSAQQNRQGYIDSAKDAAGEVAILKAQRGIVMPPLGAQRHRGSWHVEQDDTQRLLVFDRARV